jgi:hypothetical protein
VRSGSAQASKPFVTKWDNTKDGEVTPNSLKQKLLQALPESVLLDIDIITPAPWAYPQHYHEFATVEGVLVGPVKYQFEYEDGTTEELIAQVSDLVHIPPKVKHRQGSAPVALVLNMSFSHDAGNLEGFVAGTHFMEPLQQAVINMAVDSPAA